MTEREVDREVAGRVMCLPAGRAAGNDDRAGVAEVQVVRTAPRVALDVYAPRLSVEHVGRRPELAGRQAPAPTGLVGGVRAMTPDLENRVVGRPTRVDANYVS